MFEVNAIIQENRTNKTIQAKINQFKESVKENAQRAVKDRKKNIHSMTHMFTDLVYAEECARACNVDVKSLEQYIVDVYKSLKLY